MDRLTRGQPMSLGAIFKQVVEERAQSPIPPPFEPPLRCSDCCDLSKVCQTHPTLVGEELISHRGIDCRWASCHCELERLAAEHTAYMRAWCELPEAMQAMTFDALLPRLKAGGWGDALKFCQAYAQGEAPEKWVRLWGPPGTGKTHLGVAIVNYRLAHGQFAKYVYVADWLSALRATFERQRPQDNDAPLFATYEQVWQSYANAPLLLLDDLGAQHRTPWSDAELDRLLDHRYRLALETVVTTNAATVGILGGRVSDRLQDKGLIKGLHLPGPSYRPENRRVRP